MSAATSERGYGPLVVVAEQAQDSLSPVTLELVSCARALAEIMGGGINLVVVGQGISHLAEEAARATGEAVTALEVSGLDRFHGEAYGLLLAPLARQWQARAILAAHTTSGLDWLPGVAAELGAACVTGVESLRPHQGDLALARSTLFGKTMEDLVPTVHPLALTVQPGSFPAAQAQGDPPPVQVLTMYHPPCRSRLLETPPSQPQDRALGQAQVIVAAGRGIGKPENLELLHALAACFSGAALAGSRPVCDLGWLGYQSQVGLTGATVTPRLYMACGISGARQHTMGMQGAGFIVAVNSDPQAAIFQVADVCVVEDLTLFLPALLERLRGSGAEPPTPPPS